MDSIRSLRLIWLLALASTVSLLASACGQKQAATGASPPVVPVEWQQVESGSVEDSSEFVGTLEAAARVELKSESQGRIVKVEVASGDRVTPRSTLMVIQPDKTVPQLNSAQASVSVAQAEQKALVEQLQIEQNNLQVARTNLKTAQGNRNLSQVNYKRAKFLLEAGAIGRFDYDLAENRLNISTNEEKAAREKVAVAQAAVKQAEAALSRSAANIRQAQAQVEVAAVDVGFRQVTAPIAGKVGDVPARQGDFVNVGQTLTTITRNDQLDMRISVPSNNLSRLRLGLPVELIDPMTKEAIANGSISFISPRVDQAAQSVLIKARFSNPSEKLQDGQFVRARVIWGRNPGLLVPLTAITRTGGQGFVYVIAPQTEAGQSQSVVQQRPVQLGNIQGNQYEVVEGIQAGEKIATSNILRLRNGVAVQPQ